MRIKRIEKDFFHLENCLIAHKGIYGISYKLKKYVEPNSFLSCKIAVDNNISFECDVWNTLDNIPVLSHDNVIIFKGKEIKINKHRYDELVRLLGKRVPTRLEDVLEYNAGRVGVIIDVKEAHIFYSEYRRNLVSIINKYSKNTEIMVQSFNPFFMLSMKGRLTDAITCQLICRGKTILDSFKIPKKIAYAYERIISLICFIAKTDAINMENHSDIMWQIRTSYFTSKYVNNKIEATSIMLAKKIENSIYKGIKRLNKITDKIQLKLVKITQELTKKPVFVFTIQKNEDFNKMEDLYIVNYVVDYSLYGIEEYIKRIKINKKK